MGLGEKNQKIEVLRKTFFLIVSNIFYSYRARSSDLITMATKQLGKW